MAKAKLSVTVQQELAEQVQELATMRSQPLSHLVETALRQFLAAQLQAEMEEGYRVMADFDRALAEADMTPFTSPLPPTRAAWTSLP